MHPAQKHPHRRIGFLSAVLGTTATLLLTSSPAATASASPAPLAGLATPTSSAALITPAAQTTPADPTAPATAAASPATTSGADYIPTTAATDGVIYREGFSGKSAPAGWDVQISEATQRVGTKHYRGWKFTTRSSWQLGIDRMRGRFSRAHETIAVADAGKFLAKPFHSTLRSAPVPVRGQRKLSLNFDSHYRSAPGQHAVVSVSFDGGKPHELLRLADSALAEKQLNAQQSLHFTVPRGAKTAQFSWQFNAQNGGEYWGIDSVAVHRVAAKPRGGSTDAWVVSDIQGHPHDLEHGLRDLKTLRPNPAGLMMVGDIVHSGTQAEWDEIYQVMDKTQDIRPETTIASIGNHERYAAGGWAVNRDRFLSFADRKKVWGEYVLSGKGGQLPVITVGQDAAIPTDVPMSDEQLKFLEDRLEFWTQQKKQIVINTHYPLPQTVSASWMTGLQAAHQRHKQLTALLGKYPNAILFTGHTHFDGRLADWQVKRRTSSGHPDGFTTINTTAMHNGWAAKGENSVFAVEVTTGDINQGLALQSFGDRMVVKAYDFHTDEQINEVTIDNPLVK